MKLLLFAFAIAVSVWLAISEPCHQASECHGTLCRRPNTSHVECNHDRLCTCAPDPHPCLTTPDCAANTNISCIDTHGRMERFHCLDNFCNCMAV